MDFTDDCIESFVDDKNKNLHHPMKEISEALVSALDKFKTALARKDEHNMFFYLKRLKSMFEPFHLRDFLTYFEKIEHLIEKRCHDEILTVLNRFESKTKNLQSSAEIQSSKTA